MLLPKYSLKDMLLNCYRGFRNKRDAGLLRNCAVYSSSIFFSGNLSIIASLFGGCSSTIDILREKISFVDCLRFFLSGLLEAFLWQTCARVWGRNHKCCNCFVLVLYFAKSRLLAPLFLVFFKGGLGIYTPLAGLQIFF